MIEFFPSRAVALSIGPLAIHWYGVMYALAFIVGSLLLPRLLRYRSFNLSQQDRESLLVHIILGVILGGRLGYVLFYGGVEYWRNPLEILAVWHGGMASHGGFIGVFLALLLFCRKRKIDLLALADVLVIPVAIGLALGRLGNFINGELYGTVTRLPWGMAFPGAEGFRHPVQLYSVAKDLCITLVCFLHLSLVKPVRSGQTAALFLMLYGILRFTLEFVREQNGVFFYGLSEGQWLTIPIFFAGILLWAMRHSQK